MRILYVGDFRLFYSSENYIESALRELGHETLKLEENKPYQPRELKKIIEEYAPDFALFSKADSKFNLAVLVSALRKNNIPIVTWLFDLYWDLKPGRNQLEGPPDIAHIADLVFTTDGGHENKWEELGINARLLRQGVHAPEAFEGKRTFTCAPRIIFVGSRVYDERLDLLRFLKNTFKEDFAHYGEGGLGIVRGKELNNLLASTKIVVGDSQPSPRYWSNRIYEILGRGGFLIHPHVQGIEEFSNGLITYEYGNRKDLVEKIHYYLNNYEEREKIRVFGHQLVKLRHTYTHRCQTLIQEVQKIIGTKE